MRESNHQPEFEQTVIKALRSLFVEMKKQNQLLERIAVATETVANASAGKAGPRFMTTIDKFQNFDWSSIGVEVERRDRDGFPDMLKWRNALYTRRAKTEQDGNVWFSRLLGNGEYDVLIRFIEPGKSKRLDIA